MAKCRNGHEVAQGAKYCPKCGKPVDVESSGPGLVARILGWPVWAKIVAVIGFGAMVVALTLGIRELHAWLFPPPKAAKVSVVFVLDTSEAMKKEFDGTTKLQAARDAILHFVKSYPHYATSLREFDDDCGSVAGDPAIDFGRHTQSDFEKVFDSQNLNERADFPSSLESSVSDLSHGTQSESDTKVIYVYVGTLKPRDLCGGISAVSSIDVQGLEYKFAGLGAQGTFEAVKSALQGRVEAENARNQGELRTKVPALVPSSHRQDKRPDVVTDVMGTPGDGSVGLSWEAPGSDGGSEINGYRVSVYAGDPTTAAHQIDTDSTETGYTVEELENGMSYTFSVAAINGVGTGPESDRTGGYIPTGAPSAPGSPTEVMGTPGDGSVGLSWEAPGSDGGSEINGYRVSVYAGDSTTAAHQIDTDSTETGYTVEELENGMSYTFSVAAINGVGTGPESDRTGPYEPQSHP